MNYNCDLCGNRSFKLKKRMTHKLDSKESKNDIVQCSRCRLISRHPINQIRGLKVPSSDSIDEENQNVYIYRQKIVKLRKYTLGNRLLDIGAGSGIFSHLAATEGGFDVTGVELSPEKCQIAKNRYGVELLNCSIFDRQEGFDKFDIIHMHSGIESLPSINQLFLLFKNLLNNDGIILIEVANTLKLFGNTSTDGSSSSCCLSYLSNNYFLTPGTIIKYVDSNSFKVIEFNQYRECEQLFVKDIFLNPLKFIKGIHHKTATRMLTSRGNFFEFYLCRK